MSHKFQTTDWIPNLGRYAIITATQEDAATRNIVGETFVFAIDTDRFFDGKRFNYVFDAEIGKYSPVDEAYMLNVAREEAVSIIGSKKYTAYQALKDSDIYRTETKMADNNAKFAFLNSLRNKYETDLKRIAKETRADDLREIITAFFSYTIRVESI